MKIKKPKVCIVGMSASITGKGCGEIIDSHDEVVRVKHLPDPNAAHDLGRKSSTYAIIGEQIGWHKPLSNYTNQQNINKVLIVDRCSPASNLGVIKDQDIIDFIEMSDKQTDYFSMQYLFGTYSLILPPKNTGTKLKVLTTGLCVILYYLMSHDSVSIAGFASQDETTNYPSWKPELIDGELVYKKTDFTDPDGAHDLCSEIKIINLLVDNKKVRRIHD